LEEYKDYLDFKMKTGLSGIKAVEYLLNELKKHRSGKGYLQQDCKREKLL